MRSSQRRLGTAFGAQLGEYMPHVALDCRFSDPQCSGDLFVAFATGNRLSEREQSLRDLKMLPDEALDRFFVAVADATEEAIVNALCAAETMTGYRGRTAHALPVEEVAQILSRYRNL